MLSKIIKEMIAERFGQDILYPKDCSALAEHISQTCRTRISASTVQRLFGFVKGIREPRVYTLDIAARYLGKKNWNDLLSSIDKSGDEPLKSIEKLKPSQIKNSETVRINYEPGRHISLKRMGNTLKVVDSNEKKLLLNDEVEFRLVELHYPLTFSIVIREGKSIGRIQVATVSGITGIYKA